MSEPLPADLARALDATADRRGPFGARVQYYAEAGSTNDLASGLAEHGAPEGTLVLAGAQTSGRGRLGREWFSPAGAGLYLSIVCRPPVAAPFLTLAGGVAAALGIRRATGLPVTIKWPNDIVMTDERAPVRRRKLAGILAEAASGPSGVHHVVLGMGINLRAAPYPAALADLVTSIESELGKVVDAGPVLAEVLAALAEQAADLAAGRIAAVLARWRELAPSAAGARVEWTLAGRTLRGATAGIDDAGALLVRTGGSVERIIAGELHWL